MTDHDLPARLIAAADLGGAFGLLTRLPMGGAGRGAASAWAWPVAGAVVGALAALPGLALVALGVPVAMAAAVVVGVQAMLTGGLHEDGLADTADGLWGGRDAARRLEIMKDSRIGSYGVLALVVVVLARWSAVVALLAPGAADLAFSAPEAGVGPGPGAVPGSVLALAAAGALSRAPMAAVMAALPNARPDGLSRAMGRPGWRTVMLGAALALALAALALGAAVVVVAALVVAGATFAVAAVARARIGGQTGDVLGAVQQVSEVAVLATVAAAAG